MVEQLRNWSASACVLVTPTNAMINDHLGVIRLEAAI